MTVRFRFAALLATGLFSGAISEAFRRQTQGDDDPTLCKLAAVAGVDLSEGFAADNIVVSTTGTLRASMVFVDFPDAPGTDSTQDLYDAFIPHAPDWFRTSSYGALELDVAAPSMKFYRMPSPSTSYGWERGLTSATHLQYINDALAAVGTNVSFEEGSELLYIVPTKAATALSFSITYHSPVTSVDGSTFLHTVTFGQTGDFGFKTMNHETGHAMGLPDLYPTDGSATTRWTGGFDLMSLISGVAPDYGAWHKWKLGWLKDEQIMCVASTSTDSRTFTLSPLENEGGAVVVAASDTLALVAEARTSNGVDYGTICAEGVLIYAVHTDVASGEGPITVFDSRPGSGGCANDELNDAPYDNATFTSDEFGVSITVGPRNGDTWDVTVSRT